MMHHYHQVRDLVMEVPGWASALMACLSVMFIISQIAISYTYGSVVATLAMVESPATTAILRTSPSGSEEETDATLPSYSDSVDDKKQQQEQPLLVEQEVLLITPKPITSSLKKTVRHLRAETGSRLSRFRGAGVAILFSALTHIANSAIVCIAPAHPIFRLLSFVFVQVMFCRLNMLWTHMVISKPSTKSWYRRIAPRSSAKKIALPTMAYALAQISTVAVPLMVYMIVDADKYVATMPQLTDAQRLALAAKLFTVLASFLFAATFILLPVSVALIRCQAALLSEEETPIVPFDRTFGGLLMVPGSRLRMKDAWRSFDWNSRVRLAKVWVKTVGLQVGSFMVYAVAATVVASSVAMVVRH